MSTRGWERRPPLRRWFVPALAIGITVLLILTIASTSQLRNFFLKEDESLWENPVVATKDWRACAERRPRDYDPPPGYHGGNGYVGIIAEGGLNQQRIAIINAVAVARIMNCTLILPIFKLDSIWKDQIQFADVFDVEHFIHYLKDDVHIIREPPNWIPHHKEFYSSIRFTIKNIPKYASAQFYLQNVLPQIKEKKLMALKPFANRLGYENVPVEINKLRCRVNYHALKFLPETEKMADVLVARMHNRTGKQTPFMALHLRFEKGMVGLSFCDFVGTRTEKAALREYRKKEWPRQFKNDTMMWNEALCKRKQGKCPLEPGEVALILNAIGYKKDSQVYVASGALYGGNTQMLPLQRMFPNLVRKEDLASKEELAPFQRHITSLAALDFLVCLKSDVFVVTHGGNFAKLVIGARRYYYGHRRKSIKPYKGVMAYALGDPFMSWTSFVHEVAEMHKTRTGLPEATSPMYDIWENPLTPCMCQS
ncbi:protein PECTIC ARABINOGALACTAN SYNTHESIS-RELATED isoform X2 [Physcomitrium patens]|uniref:O-fucosyltransferase family protein n=1 Tax=Physcomitrium patens TaxID=3218 RepID=A0A2K1J4C4_PHYPA|nr:protein PECTIC ARABINOGALACTAN SYNTHESIS-RELATED-like isoform X2 [Physcomitrium patens]PNR36385.1 hypothetical protein PHYPA_022236 [Physcomitrium patens]|eukprot:XP_024400441.1 protein PECTIC ARABINOGALACTAN SYNTHESIS-RELATED-like isoform X2 [Physcomitrella patens]